MVQIFLYEVPEQSGKIKSGGYNPHTCILSTQKWAK